MGPWIEIKFVSVIVWKVQAAMGLVWDFNLIEFMSGNTIVRESPVCEI